MRLSKLGVWIASAAAAAVTLFACLDRLGLGGEAGWLFELLAHWPKHLFLLAFVIAVGAAALRLWRPAALASITAALNAALVLGVGNFALPQKAPEGAVLVKIVSANVHRSWHALGKVVEMGRAYGADVISIYEAPEDLTDARLAELFPHMLLQAMPSWTPLGHRLFKRSLIVARAGARDEVVVRPFEYANGVNLRLALSTVAGDVQIVAGHPPSPGLPNQMFDRNRQLLRLGDGLVTQAPFIVMGDFNTTPWARIFAAIPGRRAGDPRLEGSFPADLGPFGLPIDHVMFGGGLRLVDYQVGPDIASDHRPLLATFALPARGGAGIGADQPSAR